MLVVGVAVLSVASCDFVDDSKAESNQQNTAEAPDESCQDGECPPGQTCYRGVCYETCEQSAECDDASRCHDDTCVPVDCEGVDCDEGERCYRGVCYDHCNAQADCDGDDRCHDDACVPTDCRELRCEAGKQCFRGVCYEECSDADHCDGEQHCEDGVCIVPSCDDGLASGQQTDVDCGGPQCPGCDVGESCESHADCRSNVCDGGVCGEGEYGDLIIYVDGLDLDGLLPADADVLVEGPQGYEYQITDHGETVLEDLVVGPYDVVPRATAQGPADFNPGSQFTTEVAADYSSNLSVYYPVVHGELVLVMEWMGDDVEGYEVEGAAIVEGPGGFSEEVSGTEVLIDTLVPGDYEISFLDVEEDGETLSPDPDRVEVTVYSETREEHPAVATTSYD